MTARNLFVDGLEQLKTKYESSVSDGYRPSVAIVFSSISQNRKAIIDFFNEKSITVFGSTTAGEILDNEVFENNTVIMLLDIKDEDYSVLYREGEDTFQIARDIAQQASGIFKKPAIIIISSGLTIDAEQIIKGVNSVNTNIPLFGGLAGDDLTMKASYVFSNDFDSSNGLVALVVNSEKVLIKGLATSGWDDIGIEKTITSAKGNIVYAIDDEPAADVFVKFFKFTGSVDTKAEIIIMNFAQYPLQLKKDNGNVVLRAPLMVDADSKALIFAGSIPVGSKVKFSVPPGFDLIEKTAERVGQLKTSVPDPDAVIMFSCKARHLALGPLVTDEAEKIKGIWNKPMIGFFTYGEIGTAQNSVCDFHNETCSMVVLEEME